jgi:hypothetical protein
MREKHLQIHEEAYQTLVVTPSNDKNTINMPKMILPSVAPHSKSKYPRQKNKRVTLTREQVVLCPNEGKTSSIYIISMTFN